jgi:gliding motility-associated-like protein
MHILEGAFLDFLRNTHDQTLGAVLVKKYAKKMANSTLNGNQTLLFFLLLFIATKANAQLFNPLEFNTAANGPNAKFFIGTLDTNWYVATGDLSNPTTPFVPSLVVGQCYNTWHPSSFTNADWIAYNFGSSCQHTGSYDFYFRRVVHLPPTSLCDLPISQDFCLALDFYADNFVSEITVNGVANYQATDFNPYYYHGFELRDSANLCKGWQAGANVVVVHIKSALPAAGLLVQANLNIDNRHYVPYSTSKSICQGEAFGGHATAGVYVDTLASTTGCDSIRTLYLDVLPSISFSEAVSICHGESYKGFSATGTYISIFTAANGCDSSLTLKLTVLPKLETTQTVSICQGEVYEGLTTNGTYIDTFTTAIGCDSTRTLKLTVLPKPETTQVLSICQGESYAGHTTSGTYTDIFTATSGCDSTRILGLTVLPKAETKEMASICQGEAYEGHTKSGTFATIFQAVNGCDSTRTLELTVLPKAETTQTVSICQGEVYEGHSMGGAYVTTSIAANGCDSTRTLELTVLPKAETTQTISICQGESHGGHTVSGSYTDIFEAANGCDSTRALLLTVLPLIEPYTPNVFSPNGDGANDCFRPFFPAGAEFVKFQFNIYDRWGDHIFETSNPNECWNGESRGKGCASGVYVYIIEINTQYCGKTTLKGDVTLLR